MADGGALSTIHCAACGSPDDAGHLLQVAMRKLSEARELADDMAGRGYVERSDLVGQAISDLIHGAQRLMSRAHG